MFKTLVCVTEAMDSFPEIPITVVAMPAVFKNERQSIFIVFIGFDYLMFVLNYSIVNSFVF